MHPLLPPHPSPLPPFLVFPGYASERFVTAVLEHVSAKGVTG